MSRPVSIRQNAVLDVARRVFLKHGFGATTARIARDAGISEGSLFKHFGNKTALFMAAMQTKTTQQALRKRLAQAAGAGDMRGALEFAGGQLLDRLQTVLPCIMMVRSSGVTLAAAYRPPGPPPPVQQVRALAAYFRSEIRHGRMVMRAPEVQAQAFVGALAHYVFCDMVYGYRPASPKAYVGALVDGLLRAATPAAARGRPALSGGRRA